MKRARMRDGSANFTTGQHPRLLLKLLDSLEVKISQNQKELDFKPFLSFLCSGGKLPYPSFPQLPELHRIGIL
jgi:hypothetical protein